MSDPEYTFKKGEGWVLQTGLQKLTIKHDELQVGDTVLAWSRRQIESRPNMAYVITDRIGNRTYYKMDGIKYYFYNSDSGDPVEWFEVMRGT